jgi:hypothetical protein
LHRETSDLKDVWQICISTSRIALGIALLAASLTSSARAQARETVASVALRFKVDSRQYQLRLGHDSLAFLERAMEDSLRRMLEERFPCIEWRSPAAADTIVFRVTPTRSSPLSHVLEISLVGRTVAIAEPFRAEFETLGDFGGRRDWEPSVIARTWLDKATSILENQSQRMVQHVVGQLAIPVTVTIDKQKLTVLVRVDTARLRAAERPMPRFRVMVTVIDSGPPSTEGTGELQLDRCLVSKGYYYCHIETITYQDRTEPARQHRDLLNRVNVIPRSVHLFAYQPRPSRTSGTALSSAALR